MTDILHLNIYHIICWSLTFSACIMVSYAIGKQKGRDESKNPFDKWKK